MNCCPFAPRDVVGKQSLTVSSTAVGFTASNYSIDGGGPTPASRINANLAFCTVEDQPIRWSITGTAPTADSNGHEYAAGTSFWLFSANDIANFRAIRTGGTDGAIHATFFR